MRHHGAHLWGQDGGSHIPRPVGAGECGKVFGQGWHAEGLVEDAAALVPVTEWVPAWGAQQGERDASLSHGCFDQEEEECCCGGELLAADEEPFSLSEKVFQTCCLPLS